MKFSGNFNISGNFTAGTTPNVSSGDPYWDNVSLSLPFDGNDGDTTTADVSTNSNTVTFYGGSQISTAQSKYGGSSLSLPQSGNLDHVTIPYNTNNDIGNGDFTVECWVRIAALGAYQTVFSQRDGATGITFRVTNLNTLQFFYGNGTSNFTTSATVSANTWEHVALVRSGDQMQIYLNGSLSGSTTISQATVIGGTVFNYYIGTRADSTALERFTGYIDDFRITKGVARYTENFTPPTEAFPIN